MLGGSFSGPPNLHANRKKSRLKRPHYPPLPRLKIRKSQLSINIGTTGLSRWSITTWGEARDWVRAAKRARVAWLGMILKLF